MRVVLLAWVVGIWWLQQAAALPAGRWFALSVGVSGTVLVLGLVCAMWEASGRSGTFGTSRTSGARGAVGSRCFGELVGGAGTGTSDGTGSGNCGRVRRNVAGWRRRIAIAVLALCAGIGGYGWAAYRAEARLSDRLSPLLEGQDVTVVGVVAGLPTSTGDGVRFAFDVEEAFVAAGDGGRVDVMAPTSPAVPCEGVSATSPSVSVRQRSASPVVPCTTLRVPKHIELVWAGRPAFSGKTRARKPSGEGDRIDDAYGGMGGGTFGDKYSDRSSDKYGDRYGGRAGGVSDLVNDGSIADVFSGEDAGMQPGASEKRIRGARMTLPRAGERWQLPVRLKAARGLANWHGFDAELGALVRGVRASGYVRGWSGGRSALSERGGLRLSEGPLPGYRLAAWRERLRDDFRAALAPSARYGGVLMALALGERGDIASDDWQTFADTGVSHLLAISGLHVSLVAGAFAALVGVLWRRTCSRRFSLPMWWPAPKAAAVAGLIAAVAYGAVAGWGVPVRRAVAMVAILVAALLSGRFAAPSYALTWALAIVVALDPWAVVTPGLWLSFGAVAALVIAGRRREVLLAERSLNSRAQGVGDGTGQAVRSGMSASSGADDLAEPIAANHSTPGTRDREGARPSERKRQSVSQRRRPWKGQRLMLALGERLGQAARGQYAVTIGLIPLTLAWFGTVPLLGPVANAVAIPVMTLIVTPLALISLLLPVGLAHWTLGFAHAVVVWLADWLGMLAALPWAVWHAPVSPLWAQVAAVAGVVVCLMPMPADIRAALKGRTRRTRGAGGSSGPDGAGSADAAEGAGGADGARRNSRVWPIGIRVVGFALMGPAVFASSQRPAEGEFRITMFDIGQGNSVLVETATRTLLFDAGPPFGRRSDAARHVIIPYLRAIGAQRVDRMVVSHAHDDHFGGSLSVLRAFPTVQVFSSLPANHRVRRAATSHRTCLAGQQWNWDGITFRFFHPDPAALGEGWGGRAGPNSVSCVLRVSNRSHSALLAADVEALQERKMVSRFGSALRSDVLLAPHHGSLTSSTQAFVAAVSPAHTVFQTGYRNRFGHPRAAVVARYRAAGARIWQSVIHGGVRFSSRSTGIEVEAYRDQYRRYWHADSTETSTGTRRAVR